jgi:calcineurin-like phosphoesterase family protein
MSGRIFFTSDLHIGHRYVAELRGFGSVEEHDAALAERWDAVVNPSNDRADQVWILGDISVGGNRAELAALAWLMQRPGIKHLIAGNHDHAHPMHRESHKWQKKYLGVFESVQAFAVRKINGQYVKLSHFPYAGSEFGDHTPEERYTAWRLPDTGNVLLHGHTHTADKQHGREIHVGVDAWDLTPVALEVITDLIVGGTA